MNIFLGLYRRLYVENFGALCIWAIFGLFKEEEEEQVRPSL